ncbi:hypothetical protein [Bradyrhizobium sp. 197]|uniref:hypothetical protein n=1 Tax=unclassified Bradyrhizobium TaxID=2631580 RepID=UPI001FF9090F|nr:hypothetical protein [Bradyrhizobium sp. 197]MCK1478818.1 hypothetical protein [Bradyrhizobium sp. 197]
MFDAETTALLRAVLDEVCETVSRNETGTRTHVASKLLLKQVGRRAWNEAPTMWR